MKGHGVQGTNTASGTNVGLAGDGGNSHWRVVRHVRAGQSTVDSAETRHQPNTARYPQCDTALQYYTLPLKASPSWSSS